MRKRLVLFSVALQWGVKFGTVKVERVCWNQGRRVLFATIACLCLCKWVLSLYIQRCIHIYECVSACVCFIFLLIEPVGSVLPVRVLYFVVFCWVLFLVFILVFFFSCISQENSWSSLGSNCCLPRKSRIQVSVALLWSWPRRKPFQHGFGWGQQNAVAARLCKSLGRQLQPRNETHWNQSLDLHSSAAIP